jgi:iron complex transport system ATP-binding protein
VRLELKNVSCGYGSTTVVRGISMEVGAGESLCLLGPNGVGKTTLFKTILGFLKLQAGSICISGEDVQCWSKKKFARSVGYVPQAHTPPFPFSVLDVVLMGRTAHLDSFASPSHNDRSIAEHALEQLGVDYLKDRIYTEISGGERQMVLIARALAQQPRILIMDEPTANLDFGNQVRVLEQINILVKSGLGVLMTSHFPNHAFLCSNKVALMKRDNSFLVGSVDEIVTEKNLQSTYQIDVKIINTINNDGATIKTCVPLINKGFSNGN